MEGLENYVKAGKIYCQVKEELIGKIKPGVRLIEIADLAERLIIENGGMPAFPLNTSLNEIAAHYVCREGDETIVKEGDLLKVDMGVRVDGYIADGAFTYSSEKSELAKAAEKAVEEAIKIIRPGTRVGEIGEVIEDTIKGLGFGLIVNLTGHGMEKNEFHAAPTVPNVSTGSRAELKEGDVIAIEPFVAEANGFVKESSPAEIFRFLRERSVRMFEARQVLKIVQERHGAFPFAKRWISREISPVKTSMALRQLLVAGAIEEYPPLKEAGGQKVAQAEHTVIVSEKPIVVTRNETI